MRLVVPLVCLFAACHSAPAATPDGPTPDTFMLSDAQTAPGCDFVQRNHSTLPDTEVVPFDFTKAFTICGSIDLLHSSNDPANAVDSSFRFNVPAPTESILRFQADAPVDGFGLNGGGLMFFGHSAPIMTAPDSGFDLTYLGFADPADGVSIYAPYPTTATAPIHYKLTVSPYAFDQLCPPVTTPAEYTEQHDGTSSTGNDMTFYDANGTLTAAGASSRTLEQTGITIAGGSAHRIHGTSGKVAADAAGMFDKDTYEITTGADAKLLTIRTTPRATGDMYFLFLLTTPDLQTYTFSGDTRNGPSIRAGLAVFQVKPSTTYWLQVFAATTKSAAALPIDYDLSVCGLQGSL